MMDRWNASYLSTNIGKTPGEEGVRDWGKSRKGNIPLLFAHNYRRHAIETAVVLWRVYRGGPVGLPFVHTISLWAISIKSRHCMWDFCQYATSENTKMSVPNSDAQFLLKQTEAGNSLVSFFNLCGDTLFSCCCPSPTTGVVIKILLFCNNVDKSVVITLQDFSTIYFIFFLLLL